MRSRKAVLPGVLLAMSLTAVALTGCNEVVAHAVSSSGGAGDSGTVSIQKMGGGIDVAEAPDGANLSTMGGDIHLGHVSSFAKVKTMGGNIAVDRADCPVDATTMGGNIIIAGASGSIEAKTMAGNVMVHLTGGSGSPRHIYLSSDAGNITLTVPRGFPMQVHISLAWTRSAGDRFRIIDSLGLKQSESQQWDDSHGSPRKYIRAEGTVGSGRNAVLIDAIDGNVILKEE